MGRRLAADARLRGLHAALRNIKRNLYEGNATKEANSSGFTRVTMRWAGVSSASVYIRRQFFRDAAAGKSLIRRSATKLRRGGRSATEAERRRLPRRRNRY